MTDNIRQNEKTGKWSYRFNRSGADIRKSGFTNKVEAQKAMRKHMAEIDSGNQAPITRKHTVEQVYASYLQNEGANKSPATLTKQESMWKNHVSKMFGTRNIQSIAPGELNSFLLALYTGNITSCTQDGGYSYAYVEGFLKFFFLLFGYSQRMNFITREQYATICEDKGTKLQMPKQQKEENNDVVVFTKNQLVEMENLIKNSSLYTAYLFGYLLGVRLSECFGLCWHDVDFQRGTITINKQLNYDTTKKCFYIATPKTKSSIRTIPIPQRLIQHLQGLQQQQQRDREVYGLNYKATEYVMDRRVYGKETTLQGYDFIQRQPNGSLLTGNSMKSWSLKIKSQLGIDFKYHYLRHTHATELAMLNIPIPALMARMGHSKIDTTKKYYLGESETADTLVRNALANF